MSAFMCSRRHLSALAAYAVRHGLSGLPEQPARSQRALMEECFGVLQRENIASLDARYPNDPGEGVESFDWDAAFEPHTPLVIIKACHCYAYQACEHTGWDASRAKAIVERIEAHAVRAQPGYEQAPWGL